MASPRGTPGGVKASSSETLDGGVDVSRSTGGGGGGEIGAAPPLAILVPQRRLNGVWAGCRFKKKKKKKKKKKGKKKKKKEKSHMLLHKLYINVDIANIFLHAPALKDFRCRLNN